VTDKFFEFFEFFIEVSLVPFLNWERKCNYLLLKQNKKCY